MRAGVHSFVCLLVTSLVFFGLAQANTSKPEPYFIRTKRHTPREKFDQLVDEIDGNEGTQIAFKNLSHYSYITNLTDTQVNEIRKKDFILLVAPRFLGQHEKRWESFPNSSNSSDDFLTSHDRSLLEPRVTVSGRSLIEQQRLISFNRMGQPPLSAKYKRDDSEGQNVRLFMMDSGFNLEIPELRDRPGPIKTYVVPNHRFPQEHLGLKIKRNSIKDRGNHGTMMAIAAGGRTIGIVPKSDLELVKMCADYDDRRGGSKILFTVEGYQNAVDYVMDRIEEIKGRDRAAKIVVNFSGSPQRYSDPEEHENARIIWKDFIEVLAEHGVLFVVSAGNDGRRGLTLAHGYITSLGTSQNNVVTVGGVLADGSPYMDTTPEYTGHPQGGSLSLYGPVIVDIRDNTGRFVTGPNRNKGTSIGSAITAALLVYFLGIDPCNADPEYADLERKLYRGGIPSASKLKRYAIESSFKRTNVHPPPGLPNLNAIYNMARGRVY